MLGFKTSTKYFSLIFIIVIGIIILTVIQIVIKIRRSRTEERERDRFKHKQDASDEFSEIQTKNGEANLVQKPGEQNTVTDAEVELTDISIEDVIELPKTV